MKWEEAKAELLKLAGDEDCCLQCADWTFTHYSPYKRDITFRASIGSGRIAAEAHSLRLVIDMIKNELELDLPDNDEKGPDMERLIGEAEYREDR